jgi:hypothetical protein
MTPATMLYEGGQSGKVKHSSNMEGKKIQTGTLKIMVTGALEPTDVNNAFKTTTQIL